MIHLFFTACSKNPSSNFRSEEKRRLDAFLTKFLFEEGGAYTLFGDKPMTDYCIFIGEEKDIWLDGLSEASLQQMVYIDSEEDRKNWDAWKRQVQSIPSNHFFFVQIPCPIDPLHIFYFLVNLEQVKRVIKDNECDFKTRIGMDVDNFEEQLRNPKSLIWNKLLNDHYLMGILHGYGKENSSHFAKNQSNMLASFEPQKGPFSSENFPLPTYVAVQNDPMKHKFSQQRDKIKKIYKNKSILDVTLNRLKE